MERFPHINLSEVLATPSIPMLLVERTGAAEAAVWRAYPLNAAPPTGTANFAAFQGQELGSYLDTLPAELAAIRDACAPVLEDDDVLSLQEVALPRPNNTPQVLQLQVFRVRFAPEYALALCVCRDITEMRATFAALRSANADLASQARLIDELSVPVVTLWDRVLSVPLVGALDSRRAAQLTTLLLTSIAEQQAAWVILDITGVPVVDTQVANYLLQAIRAAQLLGCQSVLVGISPEIAQTIVQLGLDLSQITTAPTMQSGLRLALHSLRARA